jgi:hypothetical protein
MHAAVNARKAADCIKAIPRAELAMYLAAPLEHVENVVAWWEVSCPYRRHTLTNGATSNTHVVGHTKWLALDSEDQDITPSQITSHPWSNSPPSDYFRVPKT